MWSGRPLGAGHRAKSSASELTASSSHRPMREATISPCPGAETGSGGEGGHSPSVTGLGGAGLGHAPPPIRTRVEPPRGAAGRGQAHLGPAATVYIGAHGVVGASPAHVQVCSVPGLDEPDEVPALTLGPEGKREVPTCLPGPPPASREPPAATPLPLQVPPSPRTHVAILAREHALLDALRGGRPVDLRTRGSACGLQAGPRPAPTPPPAGPALTMRGSRLMSCRSRDST